MQAVPVEESVGMVLGHDITRIVKNEFKGRAFKKGHIITEEDIPLLLEIGKEHIYILHLHDGILHENDAARRIARAVAGPGIHLSAPVEGKVTLSAETGGYLHIDVDALHQINAVESVILSTIHTHQDVKAKKTVAGTRIIPLVIEEEKIRKIEKIAGDHYPLMEVRPYTKMKIGLIVTGSEVYKGRIKDDFGPVVTNKFETLGSRILEKRYVSDDPFMTVTAIRELLDKGADLIALTGGMSVDPDDQTPTSIRQSGARVVAYGAPVLPGAMFMLAYMGDVPIIGLPGCVMYYNATIFDLIVPRLMTGEVLERSDIVALGHGGLCSNCPECRYPVCPFGKG